MSEPLGYPDPLYPYGPGSRAPLADAREMPECYPIKGNIRDDGILYYHRPDSRSYRATKAEVWFDSPSAAEAAGFTLAPTHGDGTDGLSYEPGGSNHPCTAATVEANRAAVRALAAGAAPSIAPLVGGVPAGAAASGDGPRGEDGMDIEPGRPAHDGERHPYGVGSHAVGDDHRTAPVGYPIKGNVRRDGSRRYHRPDSSAYGTTNAEVWFDSPSAAEAAGFSLAASHPQGADPTRFEPGGDGHSWSRTEVGDARIRALYGPDGATAAGSTPADHGDDASTAGLAAAGLAGAGLLAAGAAALGRLGFDADLHPFGIGSHRLLARATDTPRFHPIKGNVRNDGGRIYHRPDSTSYAVTKPEVWFDSPSAAEAAGFTLSPSHPAGAAAADYEPGGSRHPWSADEVNTARLRFLHGPDWSGQLDDLPADTTGEPGDSTGGTGRAGLAAGAAALAGTAAVAGAAALIGGADGDEADDGRSAAEKLGATTLELPGPVATPAAPLDPEVTAPAPAARAGDQVTTRLSRPAGRDRNDDNATVDSATTDPGSLDPSSLDEASAGYRAGDDDAAATVGDADESDHRGAAAVAAGVAGLGLAGGAAYLASRGDGDGDDTGDTAGAPDTIEEAAAGTGAAAFDADKTVKAPSGGELAGAGAARAERLAGDTGRRAITGIGASGAAATGAAAAGGVAAGRRLTALSGGKDGSGGDGRRRGGLWAWLAAAAAAVVVLALLLSMCGGSSNTNEATGGGAKGSDLASSAATGDGSTDASSAPAGPGTSTGGESTTALQSTTQATAAASTTTAASATTQAPAGPSTSVNANDDLKVRALAALDAAGFKNVQVEVSSGQVRITGNVVSAADARKAEDALHGMSGMSGVDNALVVAETPTANAVSGDPRYTG